MIRDTRSFETQVVDAVRSINRAMGGNPSTTPAVSDQNQYEVQLINALKGIAGTLNGTGLSLSGGGGGDPSGYVKAKEFQDLARRVSRLEDESFFRLVDGNVTLKDGYSNLWVPGWLAAGGVGSGGGGGAGALKDLSDVYHDSTGVLRANGDPVANGDVVVYDSTNQRWVASAGGGGGGTGTVTGIKVGNTSYSPDVSGVVSLPAYPSGTVTRVALSVPTGFSVSGSPVTSSGTLAISFASGYKLPTTSKQNEWDAKQDAIADLAAIRSNAANGNTAYGWGDHAQAGYAMASDLAALSARVAAVENWFEVVTVGGSATLKLNPDYAGLWAEGWMSAGGVGSGGGGGGATTLSGLSDVMISNRATGDVLSFDHGVGKWVNVPKSTYLSGYATQSWVQGQGYLTQHQSLDGYVTLSTAQTITGSKTFSGANILSGADGTNSIGAETTRFNTAYIRNVYLSYLSFRDGTTPTTERGGIGFGDGYASITVNGSQSGSYMFYRDYGLFHNGNGDVPCGRSDHRWENVYSVDGNLSGDLAMASTSEITIGPVTISYDATNKALHISGTDNNQVIGLYCDGFVAAGGVQSNS